MEEWEELAGGGVPCDGVTVRRTQSISFIVLLITMDCLVQCVLSYHYTITTLILYTCENKQRLVISCISSIRHWSLINTCCKHTFSLSTQAAQLVTERERERERERGGVESGGGELT